MTSNPQVPNLNYVVANAYASNPLNTAFNTRNPNTGDVNYPVQKRWVNTSNGAEFILTSFTTSNGITTATWVEISGGSGLSGITVDASTSPGTNPVVPNLSGDIIIEGGSTFATGTQAHPIKTNSLAANTLDLQIQLAGSSPAAATTNNFGVAQFDSNQFNVTSGFVQLAGGSPAVEMFNVDTGTSPVTGNTITITGSTVAAGTHPIRTDGTNVTTIAIEVQKSQALASADATKIGLANFNSSFFTVDGNGFVSAAGGGWVQTLTGTGGGGAIPPSSGNINIAGAGGISVTGAGNTITVTASGLGITWNDVTTPTQTVAANNGYITDRGGGVVYTMPNSGTVGDTIYFVGKAGLATITPANSQVIDVGSATGLAGASGTLVSNNAGDCVTLVCITSGANATWRAMTMIGTWTLTTS